MAYRKYKSLTMHVTTSASGKKPLVWLRKEIAVDLCIIAPRRVLLRATKDVETGSEIYASYGEVLYLQLRALSSS